MRALSVLLIVMVAAPLGAETDDTTVLVSCSVTEAFPPEVVLRLAWGVAVVGGTLSLGLTAWGLGTALSDLDNPHGPPLATTSATLAWSTVLFALAGTSLEYALATSPPSSDRE